MIINQGFVIYIEAREEVTFNIFHHGFPLLHYTRFHTIKFEEHPDAQL